MMHRQMIQHKERETAQQQQILFLITLTLNTLVRMWGLEFCSSVTSNELDWSKHFLFLLCFCALFDCVFFFCAYVFMFEQQHKRLVISK